jgi:hypothetical protein
LKDNKKNIIYLQLRLAIIGNGISNIQASRSHTDILTINALVGDRSSLWLANKCITSPFKATPNIISKNIHAPNTPNISHGAIASGSNK